MPSSNRYYTRFIPREEVGNVTRWEFGSVDGREALQMLAAEPEAIAPEPPPQPAPGIDEAEHEALLRQAREEGHARGLAEGREQERLQWQQRMDDYIAGQGQEAAQRIDALVQILQARLRDLQQNMAQEVLELSCEIARQVVRQELRSNPQALKPVVQEALGMLVDDGRPATVRLNPQDHALLADALGQQMAAASVQWVADAVVPPGGCLAEQAGTVVDGTLEKRWQRAIAPLGLASAWEEAPHDDVH